LFQDFTFKVIIKPSQLNVGLDHLSRLELGESGGSLDDQLSDVDLFLVLSNGSHEGINVWITLGPVQMKNFEQFVSKL